jgi:hypothetical protein
MRSTASRAGTPDNQYGWGIIDAVAAINAIPTTGVDETMTTPNGFKLEQNFPNPFNPKTTVRYSIPRDADVTVKVYNMLGQEIRTLYAGFQTQSSYTLSWDGRDDAGRQVASGAYVCRATARLASGELFTDARTMMLLK